MNYIGIDIAKTKHYASVVNSNGEVLVDAFPFYKNELLENFLKRSKKGNVVYMSATIPKELLNNKLPIFYLNKRYHNGKLDVPIVKKYFNELTK